ncbi:membrane protein [Bacteroidia bacterium]|nr:membrane protein [Bacteroidia bacterium]
MNTIKLYKAVWGVAALSLFSCAESFLDVEPMTSVTTENYYKTIDDAERALIACYDGWQVTTSDLSGLSSIYFSAELMSDECFSGLGTADGDDVMVMDRFDISLAPAGSNIHNTFWTSYYAAIFRCNTLLQKMEQIDWQDNADARKRVEGETRTLRAILYFDLVRLLGNIPLLTEPTQDNVPQADPKDVYALIAQDLKFAADNIPADAYPKANAATNDGRITAYAAKALLARVYLYYTGYEGGAYDPGTEIVTKAEVLAGLEDIISSGEYSLVPKFKDLWPAASHYGPKELGWDSITYAGDGNVETVLAQKFNTTQDYNGNSDRNGWLVLMGLRSTDFPPYGRGWGACTVHPKMWAAFASGDTRREASIININSEGIATAYETGIKDTRDYTGYMVKKYTPMAFYDKEGTAVSATKDDGSGGFQDAQHQDYVLVRYADVLLMAAELGAANAQNYFDQVRNRAWYPAAAPAKSATPANIMDERLCEFAFEGLRYWDLLRQGIDAAAAAIAETGVPVLRAGNPETVIIAADKVKITKGLSQIPQTQINLSGGVLKQNAGW